MTIELHTWNTPNGRKISVALEEMGLPYKVFPVNITKGEQLAPAFLAISPNNKIFAILGWAWRHERHKVELSDFPHVERWYSALMARPGVKRGMEAKLD